MARITVKIDDNLEKQVRIKMAHMGGKRAIYQRLLRTD